MISRGVLNALLLTPTPRNNSSSLDEIVGGSHLKEKEAFQASDLPSDHQLAMHVDNLGLFHTLRGLEQTGDLEVDHAKTIPGFNDITRKRSGAADDGDPWKVEADASILSEGFRHRASTFALFYLLAYDTPGVLKQLSTALFAGGSFNINRLNAAASEAAQGACSFLLCERLEQAATDLLTDRDSIARREIVAEKGERSDAQTRYRRHRSTAPLQRVGRGSHRNARSRDRAHTRRFPSTTLRLSLKKKAANCSNSASSSRRRTRADCDTTSTA